MQSEKLLKNLSILRAEIKRKPDKYEPDYDLTFDASFCKYTRTSTVNLISSISEMLFQYRWPFPAYVLDFSVNNWGRIRFFFIVYVVLVYLRIKKTVRSLLFKARTSSEINIETPINELLVTSFYLYERSIFIDWKQNQNFQGKTYLIDNIRSCYKDGLWYACITSAFPLLDLLCRKFFKSNRLDRDISLIISILKKADITSNHLKPGHIAWETANDQGESGDEAIQNDLRLIGIGLGSFFDLAEIYYAWYRKENDEATELNRHAIIHCASSLPSSHWTKENAIKLLMFIDLTLRLEKPLCILLKED